jgi:hypothetical protein
MKIYRLIIIKYQFFVRCQQQYRSILTYISTYNVSYTKHIYYSNYFSSYLKNWREDGEMQTMFKKISSWLFLAGILVAVIVGLLTQEVWTPIVEEGVTKMQYPTYIILTLAIIGFVVGILSFLAIGNITQERVPTFLIAALILVGIGATAGWFAQLGVVGEYFRNIAYAIGIFAAPAAGLLAIRAIWDAGKSEELEKVIPKMPK